MLMGFPMFISLPLIFAQRDFLVCYYFGSLRRRCGLALSELKWTKSVFTFILA